MNEERENEIIERENNGEDDLIRSERQVMEDIISLYKDLPCVWDISNALHKNKVARLNALEILLSKWQLLDKNITLEGVKKKIENMRTTFFREHKKVEASKSTGAAAADVYTPSLWYYEQMLFLTENQTPNRDGVDSIESQNSSNESEKRAKKNKHKKEQIDVQSKQIKLLDSAEKLLSSSEDPTETIANAMALQLKDMTKLQRCISEKLISEVLFYGKLDQLTVNSSINLNASRITSQYPPPTVNNHNLQSRRLIYLPLSTSKSCNQTFSTPQSPNMPTINQTFSTPQSPNMPTIKQTLSTPQSPNMPTINQTLSTPQSPNMPTINQTFSTPQSPNMPTIKQTFSTPQSPNMPTINQTLSTPQSPNMPTINHTLSTPESYNQTTPQSSNMPTANHTFFQQPNVIYNGNRDLMTDFLIFNKKPKIKL